MEWLFSWGVTSVVVGVFAAAGLAFVGLNDFKLAKLCFLGAAADAAGGIIMWGIHTTAHPWARTAIVFVSVGAIAVLAVQSFRYVDNKEQARVPRVIGRVILTRFEPFYRFSQHPPAYFERINTELYVTITNQTGKPLYVQSYSGSVLINGKWRDLRNLIGLGLESDEIGLIGNGGTTLGRIDLTANGFDYMMRQGPIGVDQAIEAWMFFNSDLSELEKKQIGQFKLILIDSTWTKHILFSDYPAGPPMVARLKILPKEPVPAGLRESK